MDLTRHRRAGWLAALSLAAAACATAPPVQEMSDARQAIAAQDWPAGGVALGRIRQLVGYNLLLGLALTAIAAARPGF